MAGMLPGVECARRRRMHQAGGLATESSMGSRRSSFCLYAAGHEPHHSIGSVQRSHLYKTLYNSQSSAELDHTAREAKERLDGRLGISRAVIDSRRTAAATDYSREKIGAATSGLRKEVFCSRGKKKGRNRIERLRRIVAVGWRWWSRKKNVKATADGKNGEEQDEDEQECAVCLDGFRDGDELAGLRCGHRFHEECALPWLRSSGRCPCCRTEVSSANGRR